MEVKVITAEEATVTMPKSEYEELVRDSERLGVVKAMLEKDKYVAASTIRCVLGIEKEKEKEGDSNESV